MPVNAHYTFPPGFLWGTATAAHQVEGDPPANQWRAWEQAGRVHRGQTVGPGCGWWRGLWRDDFQRAAQAGHNALRFSVSWARIQPAPDRWDPDALAQYREWARTARALGLEPFVTLHHFTDPLWFTEQGGWENPAAVQAFAAFARRVGQALGDVVRFWATFNEPNVYAYRGFVEGVFPPGRVGDVRAAFRVLAHMAQAHAAAYEALHRLQPDLRVGIVLHYRGMRPARAWFPLERLVTAWHHRLFNDFFWHALVRGRLMGPTGFTRPAAGLRGTLDYVGLNYYTEDRVRFVWYPGELFGRHALPAGVPQSAHGEIAVVPQGFYRALAWARGFGVPIYVTENGIDDAADAVRPLYLATHVHQMWRALINNWPIRGYFHWSLMDNFEWEWGWDRHFGLWACDPQTQVRKPRSSAHLYAAIAAANGLTTDAVRRYAAAALPLVFPEAGLAALRADEASGR